MRTNLFVALVGPVESGKSATVNNAAACLGLPDNSPELVKAMAGSAEGLLRNVGEANGCSKLYCPDELSHLFVKSQIEHASFAPVLQRLYYETNFDLIIAKGVKVPVNVSLGIAGGLVDSKFEEAFNSATTGGLHSRFIFGRCPQPFVFDWRPFEFHGEVSQPVPVEVCSDVWETKSEWLENVPGMTGRIAENALRGASICAGFSGSTVLRANDLGPALEFAKYQIRVHEFLQPNPGTNPDAICAFAIFRKLEECPEKWIAKRELGQAIHAERFGPGIFRRAGENLIFNGEIERAWIGAGRDKAEFWRRAK